MFPFLARVLCVCGPQFDFAFNKTINAWVIAARRAPAIRKVVNDNPAFVNSFSNGCREWNTKTCRSQFTWNYILSVSHTHTQSHTHLTHVVECLGIRRNMFSKIKHLFHHKINVFSVFSIGTFLQNQRMNEWKAQQLICSMMNMAVSS